MTTPQQALTDTYQELRSILRDSPSPPDALTRIRALGERYSTIDFDLVWEGQPYNGSVDYSAILNIAGEGALSVSISPEDAIPWPLRDVHRYDEADLLRVNGVLLQIGEAIQLMDSVWRNEDLIRRLVEACLLREALDDDTSEISDEKLQRAMDKFRLDRGLHTADAMLAWLARVGLDQSRLEEILSEQVAIDGLRERITSPLVEDYFADHQHELATYRLRRVTTSSAATCAAIVARARADGAGLLRAAADEREGDDFLLINAIEARHCELPTGELPLDTPAGTIHGPIAMDDQWSAWELMAMEPATLDEATRDFCQRELFQRWLDERRARACIQWYWGSQQQTGSA